MNLYDLAARVIAALEEESIPYMVVGALSSSVFGIPRATKDVDIVLQLESPEPLKRLEGRLADVVSFDPQTSFETITGSHRHILTSRTRPPFTVELFELGADPFVRERFSRRRRRDRAETPLGQAQGSGGGPGCAAVRPRRTSIWNTSHAGAASTRHPTD